MQKYCYLFIGLLLSSLQLNAQSKRANVWYMSEGIQLDFNCNPPCQSLFQSSFRCGPSSCICDKNGIPQFYTNNETIWNRDHHIIENGEGLYSCRFSSQGSVVVPLTTNPNQYFLVTCDNTRYPPGVYLPPATCVDINPVKNILSLHLIDMGANNGQGTVLWKNKVIYNGHVEAMLAAVKHANTKDTWLLTYDFDINRFVSLLLTDCGIQDTVISKNLELHAIGGIFPLTFSPKGDMFYVKADLSVPGSMITHFNTATGEASNPFFFRGNTVQGCFSTDSRYFYPNIMNSHVQRYDLSIQDTAEIYAQQQQLDVGIYEGFNTSVQNGPDGKIYYTFDQRFLTWYVIDEPTANVFSKRTIYTPVTTQYLIDGTYIPNFVQSWFDPDFKEYEYGSPKISYERVCEGNKTILQASRIPPATAYHWEIHEKNLPVTFYYNTDSIAHTFSQAGAHTVKLIIDFTCTPDIITRNDIMVDALPVNYMQDTTVCTGAAVEIEAQPSQVSYLWSTGNTSSKQNILPDQSYSVVVSNTCGTITDSIRVTKLDYKVMNLVTQNNDGRNEVLMVESNSTAAGKLSVYNSWGAQIYSNNSYKNTWPEEDVAAGVYYFRYELSTCPPSNGWVQVVH
ncbi:MAG: gliding motility-associated C-terminal domain-containing protein [Cytophaga sp.]|uniref:T9SS type B sorting domain-containing protein n=1 Tax=Cytophaga sp. TaxID=29535 RepID=UPI003F7DCD5F